MKKKLTSDLTHDLIQLLKQIPRVKYKHTDGLTPSEQELIMALNQAPDQDNKTHTVTAISKLLQITPAGVTHLINPLEEARYIERLPDPNDRRVVRIGLTEKGIQEAEALLKDFQAKLEEMALILGEEDSKLFIRMLSKLSAHYSSSVNADNNSTI